VTCITYPTCKRQLLGHLKLTCRWQQEQQMEYNLLVTHLRQVLD
jgi:hypothetical protein